MSDAPRMHPADLEQLAELVAARLAQVFAGAPQRERSTAAPRLLTAAEVANQFGVARGWAYEHAGELGAVRLGDGPRGRLRFDPQRMAAALESADSREHSRGSQPTGRRAVIGDSGRQRTRANSARAQSVPDAPRLLPIRGQAREEE
jgi:hypothetical protein